MSREERSHILEWNDFANGASQSHEWLSAISSSSSLLLGFEGNRGGLIRKDV
ncbi:hypothetical protein NAP1_11468 [Erythrobacter sp. NAP1]|nr:hypothetical protein NAP1_11468 [Erythrobacter sp. NAP1]